MMLIKKLWSIHQSEFLFYLILISGCLLRLLVAFQTIEILHPDEHFQVLEPAAQLVWGIGVKTWEWHIGLRSWTVPYIFFPILKTLDLFDIKGGLIAIQLCRAFVALLSSFCLFQFYILLKKLSFSFLAKWILLSIIAFTPAWIRFSAATLSDTIALDFLWILVPFSLSFFDSNRKRDKFLVGFLLTIPFFIRIQSLLFTFGFFACFIFYQKFVYSKKTIEYLKNIFPYFLGSLTVILLQGLFDLVTWGSFLHSVYINVKKNLIENVSSIYGVEPWYYYFKHFTKEYGFIFTTYAVIAFILFLKNLITRKNNKVPNELFMNCLLTGSLFYIFVHILLAHKESRFLYLALPGLLLLGGNKLNNICLELESFFYRFYKCILLILTFIFGISALPNTLDYDAYPGSNMSNLLIQIHKSGILRNSTERCILLLGHYWVWTHGELLQGMACKYIERNAATVSEHELFLCPFVILVPQQEEIFRKRVGSRFKLLEKNPRGYLLYQKN
ncbi:MAG: hypothetical protein HY072_05390 [Deltaproteobacteria bacterium]|nr:hypothetical protein [Deltaproteobacteria bacterium]